MIGNSLITGEFGTFRSGCQEHSVPTPGLDYVASLGNRLFMVMAGFGRTLKAHLDAHDLDVREVARAAEVSERTLNHYLNEKREPDLTTFAKLCRAMRLSPAIVLSLNLLTEDSPFTLVNVTDARASAGAGAVTGNTRIRNQIAFRTDWLRNVTSAPEDELQVLEADGDSMVPTIHSGDHLLIDRTQRIPRRDGLYVIEWDGYLNVKRVTTNLANGTISIASDNPAHRSYDGVRPEDLQIVGRVIWIGRRA